MSEKGKVEQKCESKTGHVRIQYLVALLANITILTYGHQAGWISPMTSVLQSNASPTGTPLSDFEMTIISSSLCIAAVVGVPLYVYIADTYGRRVGVIAIAVMQALCWILKIFATNYTLILIARIICGIAAGGCYNTVPIYVKEISQDNMRGALGILMMLSMNIGMLTMYILGIYLDYYKILYAIVWIPIAAAVFMLKAPESPAFLVKMEKYDEAASTVAFLRGLHVKDKTVLNEIDALKNEHLYVKNLPDISLINILRNKAWRYMFFLLFAIMTGHSIHGTFAILTNASTVLTSSGITVSPDLQSLSFPVAMILSTVLSMTCVERFGRKPILAVNFLISFLAFIVLGVITLIQDQGGSVPSWLTILALLLPVCAYSAGVSPIPYIIMSEIFNFQIRAKMMGCIVSYAWFMTFFQLYAYSTLTNSLGIYVAFFSFAAANLLGLVVTLVFLPETKGKSVEQIETEIKAKLK